MHNIAPEQEGMFEAEGGWIGPYVLLVLTVLFIVVICYVYCKCRKCLKGDDSGQLPGDDGFKATPAMGGGGGGGGGELQMQPMCAHTRSPCTRRAQSSWACAFASHRGAPAAAGLGGDRMCERNCDVESEKRSTC